MGIREPVEGMPVPVSYIDLVVVPGLGVSTCMGIGWDAGGGFYDRFLGASGFPAACRAPLAFELNKCVDTLPDGAERRARSTCSLPMSRCGGLRSDVMGFGAAAGAL